MRKTLILYPYSFSFTLSPTFLPSPPALPPQEKSDEPPTNLRPCLSLPPSMSVVAAVSTVSPTTIGDVDSNYLMSKYPLHRISSTTGDAYSTTTGNAYSTTVSPPLYPLSVHRMPSLKRRFPENSNNNGFSFKTQICIIPFSSFSFWLLVSVSDKESIEVGYLLNPKEKTHIFVKPRSGKSKVQHRSRFINIEGMYRSRKVSQWYHD